MIAVCRFVQKNARTLIRTATTERSREMMATVIRAFHGATHCAEDEICPLVQLKRRLGVSLHFLRLNDGLPARLELATPVRLGCSIHLSYRERLAPPQSALPKMARTESDLTCNPIGSYRGCRKATTGGSCGLGTGVPSLKGSYKCQFACWTRCFNEGLGEDSLRQLAVFESKRPRSEAW